MHNSVPSQHQLRCNGSLPTATTTHLERRRMATKNSLNPLNVLSCKFLCLITQLIILAVGSDTFEHTVAQPSRLQDYLQVPQGSRFKIALFADLHFGEAESTDWGPEQDVNSTRVMATVLDQERPDFAIYLGDVITANNIQTHNACLYWDQAISPTRDRSIPWASVFNHDDAPFEWPKERFSATGIRQIHCPAANVSDSGGKNCSFNGTTRLELIENEIQNNTLSYSKSGPKDLWPSVSNYVLKLSSSTDPQLAVTFMYFLDSGGGTYPEVVSGAQAEWFQHTSQKVNPDSRVPEILFWHIPSQAYEQVAQRSFLGKNCVGSMFTEKVAAQEAETGIMKLIEARSSVKAVFVGHDHGLDWCCPYKQFWLCYARHTGYGGYGNWPRGARILEITLQPFSLKSWIRMEGGQSHSEVVLSSSNSSSFSFLSKNRAINLIEHKVSKSIFGIVLIVILSLFS